MLPRLVWWILCYALLGSLSLNFMLPVLDHHAAQYSPFHNHVFLGASTAAERNQLLLTHSHGAGQPQAASGLSGPNVVTWLDSDSGIVSTSGSLEGLLPVLGGMAGEVLAVLSLPAASSAQPIWQLISVAAMFLILYSLPPLEQPPRRGYVRITQ